MFREYFDTIGVHIGSKEKTRMTSQKLNTNAIEAAESFRMWAGFTSDAEVVAAWGAPLESPWETVENQLMAHLERFMKATGMEYDEANDYLLDNRNFRNREVVPNSDFGVNKGSTDIDQEEEEGCFFCGGMAEHLADCDVLTGELERERILRQ